MHKGLVLLALVASACSAAGDTAETAGSSPAAIVPVTSLAPVEAPPATTTTAATTTAAAPSATIPPEADDWYLIWVPVQLPDGFAEGIAAIDGVRAASLVRSGNGFLVETRDGTGDPVDRAPQDYVYPVEVHAYADLAIHAEFVPDDIAARLVALRDDTIMLGASSARIRNLGPGGTLTFQSGETVTVAGIVDDVYVGDAEVVTGRSDPDVFGEVRDRYMIVEYGGHLDTLTAEAEALTEEAVVVRPWRDPRVARAGDQVRSQVAFKERFGEFAIRPGSGGFVQDPAWREANIVTESIPILGEVTCHRDFVEMLRSVMSRLEEQDLADVIDRNAYAGCYNARYIARRTDISHHSWGAAADINIFNPPGRPGSPTHPALLQAMYAAGLTSGHTWNNADPGHFEWFDDVPPTR
jgi:hypothetical protein